MTDARAIARKHAEGDVYAKVFHSLWDGSLRGKPTEQLVMIYLVVGCNGVGEADVHPSKISDDTGLTREAVEGAIAALEAPDAESGSAEEGGRRLVRLDEHRAWGWRVVNYPRYRAMRSEEDRRRQNREAQARRRDRQRGLTGQHGKPESAQAEAEAEELESKDLSAGADGVVPIRSKRKAVASRLPNREALGFSAFYEAYPRRDGRRAAAGAFSQALKRRPEYKAEDLRAAAELFSKQVIAEERELQFVPMPATWLNQERFREFFDEEDERGEGGGDAEAEGPAESSGA